MVSQGANDFLMGGGGKSATFKKHGDKVSGFITSAVERQQTDFDSGAPLFWDDGKPRMQLVVTLLTEQDEGEDDDGLRKVYVKGQMSKAVADAVRKAGQRGLSVDGRLAVEYVGDGEPKRKGMSGEKQYRARYEAPQVQVPVDEDDQPF